jgi:hypothetical protein
LDEWFEHPGWKAITPIAKSTGRTDPIRAMRTLGLLLDLPTIRPSRALAGTK